ncbi:SGNH/GDSL hydrolase family protein [Anaerosporobacter faecicola]|uniref:SGNH/GDSL hydrolase family protein n=1 Tax=Anaerosporobacter faecicola TaxID=2718714 RepID=UPI00143B52BB|nr:GDSL-type esterase/lipase family protein [Anaerosporobacter faecicola]
MNKQKVVCMGDSITEGFGLGDDASLYYPSILQEYLGDCYEVYNKGVTCSCATNTTLADGRTVGFPYPKQPRYFEALELAGDIYILMLGTNDAQDGRYDVEEGQDPCNILTDYEPQFTESMQKIVDAIRKANADSVIFVVKPVPIMNCIWRKHQQKYLDRLFPHYEELVHKNTNMHLLSAYDIFRNYQEQPLETLYQEDGLHPNAKGAQVLAKGIYEGMKLYL